MFTSFNAEVLSLTLAPVMPTSIINRCSFSGSHDAVLHFSFMTYYRLFNKRN